MTPRLKQDKFYCILVVLRQNDIRRQYLYYRISVTSSIRANPQEQNNVTCPAAGEITIRQPHVLLAHFPERGGPVPAKAAGFLRGETGPTETINDSARFSLILWSRPCDWKEALVIVKPETLIGWHRKGFKLFWKGKSQAGRPRIPENIRKLIVQVHLLHWLESKVYEQRRTGSLLSH